jgi:hypothetical protein
LLRLATFGVDVTPALGSFAATLASRIGTICRYIVSALGRPSAIVSSGRVVEMDFVERCLAVSTIASVIMLVGGFAWLMVH